MKVILTQEVPNLGEIGTVEEVADGYARNYLIPRGLAVKATQGAVKEYKRRRAAAARREARMAERAESLAEAMEEITITFEAKAGETGRLYGSITMADVAEALEREIGEEIDRRKHLPGDSLREIGRHVVPVQLTTDVQTSLNVIVKPEDGELPEEEDSAVAAEEPAPEE